MCSSISFLGKEKLLLLQLDARDHVGRGRTPSSEQASGFSGKPAMETDLASFLSPAGSLVGEVTQRVLEFLSVQDLIEYVASSASSLVGSDDVAEEEQEEEEEGVGSPEIPRRQRQRSTSDAEGAGSGGGRGATGAAGAAGSCRNGSASGVTAGGGGRGLSPEDELPHHLEEKRSTTGAGDEAGGGSRPPTPYRDNNNGDETTAAGAGAAGAARQQRRRRDRDEREGVDEERGSSGSGSDSVEGGEHGGGSGRGVRVVVRRHDGDGGLPGGGAKRAGNGRGRRKERGQGGKHGGKQGGPNILGILIGLGLRPWAALGVLRGGVAHLLRGVPLLALLRWAAGGASAVLGLSFRVALLPYDVTTGVVGYVVGSLEAMLNVATEVRK